MSRSRPPRPDRDDAPLSRRKVGLRLRLAACLARMCCELCGRPLAEPPQDEHDEPHDASTDPIEWDHEVPLALGGAHDARNVRPVHAACHKRKTAVDAARLAKVERQAGRAGQRARRRARKQAKRARLLGSRPFLANRSGPLKKRLDGTVVRRARTRPKR